MPVRDEGGGASWRRESRVRFEIDYLARHERYLPLIAEWQLAEFGHLNDIRLPLTAARKANLTGRVGAGNK